MSWFRRWWRNENYDREYMRRFREHHHDLDDLPDHIVAQLIVFQAFAFGEAVRDVGRAIRTAFPIIDRLLPPTEED